MMLCLQDRDKNGFVEVDELTNLHSTTRERLTVHEARNILQVKPQMVGPESIAQPTWACDPYRARVVYSIATLFS